MNPLTPPWPRDLCEGVADVGIGKIAASNASHPLLRGLMSNDLLLARDMWSHGSCGRRQCSTWPGVPFALTDLRTLA